MITALLGLVSVEMLKAQEVQLKDLRERILQTRSNAAQARVVLSGLAATQDREAQAGADEGFGAGCDGGVWSGHAGGTGAV